MMTERSEALQATARELASTEGVDAVLAAIARRAGAAVRAPRYVLAVNTGAGETRLHHHGFPNEAEAREVADKILAQQPEATGEAWLVVDVVSGSRHFGRLAALYPDGGRFFPTERRLLEAYAANAGAALNVVTRSTRPADRTAPRAPCWTSRRRLPKSETARTSQNVSRTPSRQLSDAATLPSCCGNLPSKSCATEA